MKLEKWELESLEMDLVGIRQNGVESRAGNEHLIKQLERLVAELKEVSRIG